MEQKEIEKKLIFFSEPETDCAYKTLIENAQSYSSLHTHVNITPFLDSIKNREFSKALRQACHVGIDYLVEILLAYLQQAKPESKSVSYYIQAQSANDGRSALHWAAIHAKETGKLSILATLLEHPPLNTYIVDDKFRTYHDYLSDDLKEKLEKLKKDRNILVDWQYVTPTSNI